MIVVPCSIRTLSSIAYGMTDTLITRAADVTLKERRRLVLSVRETPLHLGHLRAMVAATEAGAIVAPPMPAFYEQPESVGELVDQMAARLLGPSSACRCRRGRAGWAIAGEAGPGQGAGAVGRGRRGRGRGGGAAPGAGEP